MHYNSSEDKAREVADRVGELGGEALPVKGDVSDSGDVRRMTGELEDRYGRVDVLEGVMNFQVGDSSMGLCRTESLIQATYPTKNGPLWLRT